VYVTAHVSFWHLSTNPARPLLGRYEGKTGRCTGIANPAFLTHTGHRD
jgi:hypothetical protein